MADSNAVDAVLPKPMVVAMSANADHVTMQDSYAAGADHFLPKPFDIDTFYAVLHKYRKQQRKLQRAKRTSRSTSDASKIQ